MTQLSERILNVLIVEKFYFGSTAVSLAITSKLTVTRFGVFTKIDFMQHTDQSELKW